MSESNCAGFIIQNINKEVAIVFTKRGYASLPKGKRNKNETNYECATRELNEETGIEDFIKVENIEFDELDKNGKCNIKYFYGLILDKKSIAPKDLNELSSAKWVKIENMHTLKWRANRLDIIKKIQQYLLSRTNV
jgi:8-oxo-dGTP pyrophosphatase MutT (NUDIX family)